MSTKVLRLVLCAWLLVVPTRLCAAPIVIDFESLTEGSSVGSSIPGLTFSNASVLTAGITLNEFEFPPASGVNVIFDDGGPIRIGFGSPISAFSGYFTYALPLTLQAYDASNVLLGSALSGFGSNLGVSGDAGSAPDELLQLVFPNISSIVITGDPFGGSFIADDIGFTTPTAVPEPATLGLVLLGGVGVIRRCRRASGAERCG